MNKYIKMITDLRAEEKGKNSCQCHGNANGSVGLRCQPGLKHNNYIINTRLYELHGCDLFFV